MPDFFTDYFEGLTRSFLSTLSTPDKYLNKVVLTTVVIILSVLLHMLIKYIITSSVSNLNRKCSLHKILKNSMITLTIILNLFIWIQAINVLVLTALLFGFFAVFMFRGLTNNIIGFVVIKYRKYFLVGHRVEINGIIGDVIEINPISFQLLEARNWLSSDSNTGRVIKLPNKIIFEESIEMVGITNEFIWQEIQYVLSFDSNWQDAERIMTDAGDLYFKESVQTHLKENNEHLPSQKEKLQPVFSLTTNDEGIILTLRYLVDYKSGTSVRTSLQRKILTNFNENPQIKFAVSDIRILPE